MQNAVSTAVPAKPAWISTIASSVRADVPTLTELAAAIGSALLLILSFPDFDYYFLAWISFVPLLLVIARRPSPGRAFILGWIAGTLFFYASCYWLTYSMIHYGELSPWLAYLLLAPATIIVGLFPALFALLIAVAIRRWGYTAILLAPFIWASSEWVRLGITGQLWNAIGYSQADALGGSLIQVARWGGVYAVGFLILTVNSAIVFAILKRGFRPLAVGCSIVGIVGLVLFAAISDMNRQSVSIPYLYIVALQPNVPMTPQKSAEETKQLLERHLSMSASALSKLPQDNVPRLVVWPESPMNLTYASDKAYQEVVNRFAKENHTSLLFNSLEPAPNDGDYNSALMVNEQGSLIAQYDKIRLLPFGEYVPLPQWLGGSLISAIVGDFTPGNRYTLMPVAAHRAGVFICIESAYPSIARTFTSEGADVLINISNDGYLGPTAVMRQHLANAIFRAVENGRPLLRVTNSGLSADIRPDGFVRDQTLGFQADVRTWRLTSQGTRSTFYTKHGDLFVVACTFITAITLAIILFSRRRDFSHVR